MFFTPMLSYLNDLEMHNNRTWFHETHKRYESVRADFETFTQALVEAAAEVAPSMAERMRLLPVKKFIYRTARDVRYAAGKPPYKTWFACALSDEGREKTAMSFYVQIAPQEKSEICVGVWFTDNRKTTDRIRRYISDHAEEFSAVMADETVQSWFCGDKVSRTPKGFDAHDPMIEYIKHKQWMLFCPIRDSQLTDLESVTAYCKEIFYKMEPFRAFFERAMRWYPDEADTDDVQEETETADTAPLFWPTAKPADDWDF